MKEPVLYTNITMVIQMNQSFIQFDSFSSFYKLRYIWDTIK